MAEVWWAERLGRIGGRINEDPAADPL